MKSNAGYEARDIFVRFRDMLTYILLRWKSVVLVAVAASVLVAGLTYRSDSNRYNSIEKAQTPEETPVETLDAEGLAHVALVQRHQRNYDSLCTYNTTAPMMKIDFQAVPTYRMNYLITGARGFATAALYRDSLKDEMLYVELAKEFSTEEKEMLNAHLAELVSVSLESNTVENQDGVLVCITVIAPTQKMCKALAEVVRDTAALVNKKVQQEVGGSYGRWMFDEYGVVRREEVRDLQLKRLADQEQARLSLEKATDALTTAEEDYLFVRDKEEEPTLTYPVPTISVMAAVLGLIGGALMMILLYGLRYLYCGRVLSAVEMEVRHGLSTFGTLAGIRKRFFVDRWVRNHLQEKPAAPFLLWHRMALTAKNAGIQSVYLVGDPTRMDGLAEVMEQQGVSLQIGDSPLSSPEALAALAGSQALILTADLEVTRHTVVTEELDLARQLGCQVLGVLLVKE